MSLKFFLNEGLSEPNLVAISEGMGSGSKLFQSLIDSHDEVIMVPGYALMYFYPYWEKYIEDDHNLDWLNIVDRLINLFASIFNTTINP